MTDKQINIGLGLLALFVAWLFVNTFIVHISRKENNYPWKIIETETLPPIVLNKTTGETWGFFRSRKDGEIIDDGWTPLFYKFRGRYITPNYRKPKKVTYKTKKVTFDDGQKGRIIVK